MPFIFGFFGKDVSHNQMEELVCKIAQKNTITKIQNSHFLVYAGLYPGENLLVDTIISTETDNGIFVGKIFERNTYQRIKQFSQKDASHMITTPSMLAKKYWGRYAGFLYDPQANGVILVRDPIGLSSLFYLQTEQGTYFSTQVSLLYDIAKQKPQLNLSYFNSYIYGSDLLLSTTPFMNIFELMPAECVRICLNNRMHKELFWDINTIKSSFIKDEKEFEHDLRETILKSLRAWFSDATGVCVELSGGCDSTALILALKQVLRSDQKLIAVNYIDSKEPLSNEISYAQEVADLCNVPLHYIDWSDDPLFDETIQGIRSNKPTNFFLSPLVDQKIRTIAFQNGCSHIVNGQGGDHIFLEPFLEYALADYWMQKGIKGSFFVLKDLAWYHNMPLIKIVAKNMYQFLRNAYQKKLPAKQFQLQMVEHAVVFAQRNQKDPRMVMDHPFLFAPVVELGLQIPTYQTFDKGYTRILFRRAMSDLGRPKGLWRTRKSFTSGTITKKFVMNVPKISQLLETSILVSSGLVSNEELDVALEKLRYGILDEYDAIAKILYAQLWLTYWKL